MEAVSTSIYIINDLNEKIEEGSTNTFPDLKNDVSSQIIEIQNQSRLKPESIAHTLETAEHNAVH